MLIYSFKSYASGNNNCSIIIYIFIILSKFRNLLKIALPNKIYVLPFVRLDIF